MANSAFKIEGLEEAIRKVQSVRSALEAKQVDDVLLKGARVIRDDAKRRVRVKTGAAKRALNAKKSKNQGRWTPSAFASVDRKKAPHFHLLEFGTSRAPAYPALRPAAESTQGEVAQVVTAGLKELIDQEVRR